MIGLVITGRTYNPETYEISINPVQAKVIDTGISSLRFWTSYSREQFSVSVDFFYCAKWNGTSYSTTDIVRMPACLVTSVSGATVDTSLAELVQGKPNIFSSDNIFGDPELFDRSGGIIVKVKCPVIYFKDNDRTDSLIGVSDFLMCYPSLTLGSSSFNYTSLVFFDESKSSFISPTFIPPSTGSGELTWKASGIVNSGVDVTLGNLKVRMSTAGNRSLQVSTVTGTYSVRGSGVYSQSGVAGSTITPLTITTTPSYINAGYNFNTAGATDTWILMDEANTIAWRITMIVGSSYNNNLITIERLL